MASGTASFSSFETLRSSRSREPFVGARVQSGHYEDVVRRFTVTKKLPWHIFSFPSQQGVLAKDRLNELVNFRECFASLAGERGVPEESFDSGRKWKRTKPFVRQMHA